MDGSSHIQTVMNMTASRVYQEQSDSVFAKPLSSSPNSISETLGEKRKGSRAAPTTRAAVEPLRVSLRGSYGSLNGGLCKSSYSVLAKGDRNLAFLL
jgi:hypothetical protein